MKKVQVTKSLALNREETGALVFIKGTLLGTIIRIRDEKEIVIGRDPIQSDVVIRTMSVSRKHCKITFHKASGNYSLIDCSKNGVYRKDGKQLPPKTEIIIESGDELWIGDEKNIIRLG